MAAEHTTVVGVTGHSWRASVTPWGAVVPWGNGDRLVLDWFVAADDRWHRPADEPAVRQRRIDGTPVTETRVRVPDGDAVQRVWSVATGGGATIVEVENESPLPFAVAFCGLPVVTERPPAAVPVEGIDLPADTIVLPVGHHATARIAIPHGAAAPPSGVASLAGVPAAADVVRGWLAVTGRASRVDVPDAGLGDALTAARCDVLLAGPVDAATDPIGFVLDIGELVRCGEPATPWLTEIVGPLETVARSGDPYVGAAFDAGERVAIAAGDARAAGDIARLRSRIAPPLQPVGSFAQLHREASAGRFVHDVERHLAAASDLLPTGIPERWYGADFEVHGVPTSARSSVAFAVRWHGERPAVLWEQAGEPQRLTASAVDPGWSSTEPAGDALWAPPRARPAPAVTALAADDAPPSFA